MTSSVPPTTNPTTTTTTAAQTANAASSSASGTTSPLAAGSAPTARSYANATKKTFSPPSVASDTPPVAVGGPAASAHHAKNNSVSPVNGKTAIQPAVPALGGAPTIVSSNNAVNGNSAQGEHTRKSSTATFSASGTTGYMPNGAPTGPNGRPKINFGSMGSPAPAAHSVPHYPASTGSPAPNPRVTVPAKSPSPIPQPVSTSGGKPPAGLQGQGNVNFGSITAEGAEANMRPVSMPPVPSPHLQASHLRRESSQSAHSDMGTPGMNRGYPPSGGRGRGGFTPGYPQMGHSPSPSYRQLANQQRGPPNMPGQFQGQAPMGPYPGSPMRQPRSPAITPATIQQQQTHIAGNPQMQHPYGGYQPHFQQGMYGMPQQYDPAYAAAYYPPQYNYPGMMPQPPAPRGQGYPPHMAQQSFVPGQYAPTHPHPMSRTPSQVSERPPSALGQPPAQSMPPTPHVSHSHTPSHGSSSPAPSSSNFTIQPKKTSRAIPIVKPDGGVINFEKKSSSPAPVPPKSPVVVSSSTPTPPPRVPSAAGSQHERSESKTAAEKKNEFIEQFKSQLSVDQAVDQKKKEDDDAKAAKEKAEAEAKAAKEKEEAEAKAAKEREAAEKAKAEEEAAKAKEAAEKAKKEEEERLKREEDERLEREIAEMEELERQEEERERKYQEKKKAENEEKKKREAEAKARLDEELKAAERAAEEAEKKREQGTSREETTEDKEERARLFAELKRPALGPGSAVLPASESGASTPMSDVSMPPPSQPVQQQPKSATGSKPKPAALKLETTKPVEPAQPTAGMQALKSARFIQIRAESVLYPEGIKSPNPALNQSSKSRGRQYDKSFLLQFQDVFKEKPSIDWDSKVKETVGDGTDSARPQSARPSMGNRQPSGRPSLPTGISGPMGSFIGGRTLPPGTTSQQRFEMAASGSRPTMTNPLASFAASRPGGFPMGGSGQLNRTGSFPNMAGVGPNSPRTGGSQRGKGSRRGLDKAPSKSAREEEAAAKSMPLTAGQELKPLEVSKTGWKPMSLSSTGAAAAAAAGAAPGGAAAPSLLPNGHMPPDMVQRKVKAALNKMTPEKFDKIADQILEIAAQSKDEQDGRTLRQVIQLTFEKACDEAHWASMYAKFCKRMLETMSPEIKDLSIKDKNSNPVVGGNLFRKYLLNRCQEEFERGWEVNLPQKPEGEESTGAEAVMLSDEYYIAAAAKRKGLGLIQFIGELYKLGMLTLRIMHECVVKLLNFEGMPDESGIESLVKLLKTVGATMDATENGPKMINTYFERIENIMKMDGLPSRMRFMLMDTVDLRRKGWKSKDDAKGPKTIQEIHAEAQAAQQAAEMERQRSSRNRPAVGRGDARSFSGNMPPPDYPRNQVGMDDLRKLAKSGSGRNTSLGGPANLGPSSMFGSRSSSGRKPLGPSGLMRSGDESGASSRTGTPPVKDKESGAAHTNTFSALAALDGSGEGADDVASPPSTASSPSLSKTQPAGAKSSAAEGAAKEASGTKA